MLKKLSNIILIFVLIIPYFLFPIIASAGEKELENKTLAEIRQELADYEKNLAENEEKERLTQAEIDKITNSITENTKTIERLSEEMIELQNEITQAEKDIEEKDKEIKEIINFLQVANGESAYLEYAFGAKDFTDFIYRMAISEQLSSYNEELVDEYNTLIENNKKKKKEKEEKQESLKKVQTELATQKNKLGEELKTTSAASLDINDEIEDVKKTIKYYAEEVGCNENETIGQCLNRKQTLPIGTEFYRPIVSGRVTSEFGSRCFWLNGKYTCDFHGGLDMSQSGSAVPVYAAAPGVVIGHTDRGKCGGNMVYVIHNINGKKYTSMYAHLRQITVKDNQIVTMDTQIGIMGGNPAIEYWDECSTGQHVHFTLANGHYKVDYLYWSQFEARMFNPRILLNAPAIGGSFSNRFRKY